MTNMKFFLIVILGVIISVLTVFQDLFLICHYNIVIILSQSEFSFHLEVLPIWLNDVIPEHLLLELLINITALGISASTKP